MSKNRTKEWEELQERVKEEDKIISDVGIGIYTATLIMPTKQSLDYKDYSEVIFDKKNNKNPVD